MKDNANHVFHTMTADSDWKLFKDDGPIDLPSPHEGTAQPMGGRANPQIHYFLHK